MCRVLDVSSGGYYAWRGNQAQPHSKRETANQQLGDQIWTVFRRSQGTYGSPRIYAELRAGGVACSRNRVARLMKRHGIAAKRRRLYKMTTTDSNHSYPVAPNLLNRHFSAERPNEKWLTDITYIPTREGWLYLAAVLDVYSRKVVGWAVDGGDKHTTIPPMVRFLPRIHDDWQQRQSLVSVLTLPSER